jgi:hypothetical protein
MAFRTTSPGGLTDEAVAGIRQALRQPWAPALPQAEVERRLSWFPDSQLHAWFARGDGCHGVDDLRALSLEEALRTRRELLLRDLGRPLASADCFLPLLRCADGLIIYDGAAAGLVLRPTRSVETYAQLRRSPLPLSALLDRSPDAPRASPTAAAVPAKEPYYRTLRLAWFPRATQVEVHVVLESGQASATARQVALVSRLETYEGELAAEIEAALFLYYQSIRGRTDYGDPAIAAEAEPPLGAPEEIWGLLSRPRLYVDVDDPDDATSPGFEVTWRATFDDEHGVAVRVEEWSVTGVGTFMACRPLPGGRLAGTPGLPT